VKASLTFKFIANAYLSIAEVLGPLNAKTYMKALLAFRFLPTPMCFNVRCESRVGLPVFCQHLHVLMAVVLGPLDDKLYVKASLVLEVLANTYVF
jgi:hypothetical protein